jgi:hypothetical protein
MNEKPIEMPCHYVGEFVDDLTPPANSPPAAPGEIVPTEMVGEFTDDVSEGLRRFVVVFQDRIALAPVELRASGLRTIPEQPGVGTSGCYALWVDEGGRETIVGLFSQADVLGIFEGSIDSIRANQPTAAGTTAA